MKRLHIGIELGARTLKLAWLTRGARGSTSWGYREQPRSQEAGAPTLARDLAQLLRPMRAHRFTAQVFLAAPDSYIRRFTLRVPTLKQLPEAIRAQLPTLLPFDVDRAQVQHTVHRQQPVDGQLECTVSVAACERAAIQQELEALWRSGWVLSGVAPASLALEQSASALQSIGQESMVLMAFGERRTTMVLVEAGAVVYARDVALGSDHLADAVMSQVGGGEGGSVLSHLQAHALLQEVGVPTAASDATVGHAQMPVTTYRAMVQPVLEQLVSELRRTMTFGVHTGVAVAPTKVIVSGDAVGLPHFDQWLAEQLGVPVMSMSCESLVGSTGATASLVCGLALFNRRPALNLQPPSWHQRGMMTRVASRLWRSLVVLGLLLWLGVIGLQIPHHRLSRQLRALKVQEKSFQPVVDLQTTLDAHTGLAQRLAAGQGMKPIWLRQLARGFPNAVRLTQLSVDAQHHVHVVAEAQEREQAPESSISELSLWLEHSGLCKGIQLGASRRVNPNGKLIEFDLTCQLVR